MLKFALIIATFCMFFSHTSMAISPAEQGLAIARKAKAAGRGWQDYRVKMEMVLLNKNGEKSTRKLRLKYLEGKASEDKSLIVFETPRAVKGTALLTHSKVNGNDDQWLYLPAVRRVKRIATGNKDGSFMGSEFAYEDLSSQAVSAYSYKYLREEACGPLKCHVIERVPQYEGSGYSKQEVWYDQAHLRIQKIDYYDRKKTHLKTMVREDYQEFLSKYWRATKMSMSNVQNGKRTNVAFADYQFRKGLKESDFSKLSLKRQR